MTDDLTLYRAHRFAITRIGEAEFALFDPSGTLIGIGTLDALAPMILTGEAHYEQCLDAWTHLPRHTSNQGQALLEQLGLATTPPSPISGKLERRL